MSLLKALTNSRVLSGVEVAERLEDDIQLDEVVTHTVHNLTFVLDTMATVGRVDRARLANAVVARIAREGI